MDSDVDLSILSYLSQNMIKKFIKVLSCITMACLFDKYWLFFMSVKAPKNIMSVIEFANVGMINDVGYC